MMNWFFLAVLGMVINSVGLCFFGDAVIHRAMANGAIAAGFFNGVVGLILINLGIWLIAEGVGRRRAARGRE